MNQKSLIHLYNSMFDDTETEEEIKDSISDSHEKLSYSLSKTQDQKLFDCIIKMMEDHRLPHKNNEYLSEKELDQIETLSCSIGGRNSSELISYFHLYDPENGDFSIIFKYLRNIKILDEYCFNFCPHMEKITIPDTVKKINGYVFINCLNLKEIVLPKSIKASKINWSWLSINKFGPEVLKK